MQELLPVSLGILVGILVAAVRSVRLRTVVYPIASVAAGAAASFLNGELAEEGAAVFLSFDALLVWLAAAVTMAAIWSVRRLQAAP
jgi:hypothetical protein